MPRILVIDDDPALVHALRIVLQRGGYDVLSAATGAQGIYEAAISTPDVVVLDLGLPDLDGVVVCRRIHEWSEVPIIVLSAASTEARKVTTLDEGANDYVTKPFGMAELEARIRAALRHRRAESAEVTAELTVGPIDLDLVHREVHVDGELIELTTREFDLLAFLSHHAGKVCTHQMILDAVWGPGYGNERQYLHTYIHRLRQRLLPASHAHIDSTPGVGYVLRISGSESDNTLFYET